MKFLNVAIIIFLTIILTPVESKTKVERIKEVENVISSNIPNSNPSDNGTYVFVSGESNRDKELRRERERLEELNRANQASYTRSYTGQGYDIKIVGKDNFYNCVAFAKWKTNKSGTMGAGARQAINSQTPQVGAIASERGIAHASVVIAIHEDSIRVIESNYRYGYLTERTIPKNQVLGYVI